MSTVQFTVLKLAVQKAFEEIQHLPLFTSKATKDELWDTYLAKLTELGHNEIFCERGEHDCQCCKAFIRKIGNIVAINPNGNITSIWDIVDTGTYYDELAKEMATLVKGAGINGIFLHEESTVGTDSNVELIDDKAHTWEHFYVTLPPALVETNGIKRNKAKGRAGDQYGSLKLSMEQLNLDAVQTIIDLVDEDAIYRGTEHKKTLRLMRDLLTQYAEVEHKEYWLWLKSRELGDLATVRSTVIGSLVKDVSSGMDLEQAVKSYEAKVAPHNYKRSKKVVTKGMIEKAEKTVVALGMAESLPRRHASITDITINNVLFADNQAQAAMTGGIFGELMAETKDNVDVNKAQDIGIEDFIKTIVPNAKSIDALLDNRLAVNTMSLVAPVNADAPNMLKWDNNFSWTYNGDITDSDMQAAVVAAGGRVDGAFRFTHSWNHTGQNQSLMDLHVFHPNHSKKLDGKGHHDYGNNERVGWNHRKHNLTRGVQDVDFTTAPKEKVPVENITYPDLALMPDGEYLCAIQNWSARSPNQTGFKAEVAFGGQVFEYDYKPALQNNEWVKVATVTKKGNDLSIEHHIPCGSAPQDLWGLKTQKFHRVSSMMLSPNYWDDNESGNKHYFFMIDGLKNPDPVRGFYNEFLTGDLKEDRKVFEVLGNKMKAPYSDDQLSGLGFSSTQRNNLIVRVDGGRLYNINF